jgi:hypothetical protein
MNQRWCWGSQPHGRADIVCGFGIADVSTADVLDECRVEVRLLNDGLERLHEQAIELGVLEATLICFGEWCTDGECDDNIVRVLGGAGGALLA